MISGVAAVRGARSGSMWKWLAVGLATFCVADVVYALQVAANTYAVGTAWSSLWLVGLTIVAMGIWRPQRPAPLETARSGAILAVPTVATITAVVVLVVPSFGRATTIVDALAVVTLVLAGVRIFIGFRRGPATLRRPPPGRDRRAHRGREPARALRAWRAAPARRARPASVSR